MTHRAMTRNPFLLMTEPEVVLAAIANSACLSRLDRHLCRPLDRLVEGEEGSGEDVAKTTPSGDERVAERVDGRP